MKDNDYIIFGDSITYGLYDKEMCGWVNRVRQELENKNKNNFVINLGIPGQNSTNIKNRFEIELKNRYNNTDNFILIYAIGIKDASILKNDLNHINIFKENIKYIIDITRKYTNNIYFIGLIEPNYSKRKEYTKENVFLIDDTIKTICENNKVNYIKVRDKIKDNLLVDGLHPNEEGHKFLSKVILENIIQKTNVHLNADKQYN